MKKELSKLKKLEEKIKKLPGPSPVEKELTEKDQLFEATYYSNKLEGNKLSKNEARKAISL